MDIQKILLKIAYWLVALSIVVLIAFYFFARHVMTGPSGNISVRKIEKEEKTNIEFSGMSVSLDNKKAKKEMAELKAAMKKGEEGKTDK